MPFKTAASIWLKFNHLIPHSNLHITVSLTKSCNFNCDKPGN